MSKMPRLSLETQIATQVTKNGKKLRPTISMTAADCRVMVVQYHRERTNTARTLHAPCTITELPIITEDGYDIETND